MLCNERCYSFYITTNSNRNVLYCGVTNDLQQRIIEHYLSKGNSKTFAGKCYCYWLIYFEHFKYINDCDREGKRSKKMEKRKKEALIDTFSSEWKFLNFELFDSWPPKELWHRKDL